MRLELGMNYTGAGSLADVQAPFRHAWERTMSAIGLEVFHKTLQVTNPSFTISRRCCPSSSTRMSGSSGPLR